MNIVKRETESAIRVVGVLQLVVENSKPVVHQKGIIQIMSHHTARIMKELNDRFTLLEQRIHELLHQNGPEWVSVSDIALDKGLDKSTIHKQLQNGNFEEDIDFKRVGNRIVVHQGAIKRIQRKRRS